MPTSHDAALEIEQQLEAVAHRVPEIIAALEADRSAIDERIRKLRGIAKVYGTEPKARIKSKNGGGRNAEMDLRRSITLEVAEWILAQVTVDPDFEFTPGEIKQALGFEKDNTSVNQAISALRTFEYVARTRKEGNRQFYRADRLAEKMDELRAIHAD